MAKNSGPVRIIGTLEYMDVIAMFLCLGIILQAGNLMCKGIELLVKNFAPQPAIGLILPQFLPKPASAAWNFYLISRGNPTFFALYFWNGKWKGFYVVNWKNTVLLRNKSNWTLE